MPITQARMEALITESRLNLKLMEDLKATILGELTHLLSNPKALPSTLSFLSTLLEQTHFHNTVTTLEAHHFAKRSKYNARQRQLMAGKRAQGSGSGVQHAQAETMEEKMRRYRKEIEDGSDFSL